MLRKSVPTMVLIKEHLKRTKRLKTGMMTAMTTRSTVEKCGKTDTKLTLSLERGHLDRYVDASEWVCWVNVLWAGLSMWNQLYGLHNVWILNGMMSFQLTVA